MNVYVVRRRDVKLHRRFVVTKEPSGDVLHLPPRGVRLLRLTDT